MHFQIILGEFGDRAPEMKTVIEELGKAGLRDRVKVLIRGAHVIPRLRKANIASKIFSAK